MTETFDFKIEIDYMCPELCSFVAVNTEVLEKKIRQNYDGFRLAQKGIIKDEYLQFRVVKIFRQTDISSDVVEGVLSPNSCITFTRPKGVFFTMVSSETFVESPTAANLTLQEENTLLRKHIEFLQKQLLQELQRGTQNILF